LPEFIGRLIEEVPESWRRWGVLEKDKKKIQDQLAAVQILKERGVKGSGIIDAYHAWRVVPLMRRALPLHMMAPRASLDGMALAEGALSPSKVVQRIKEAMEPSWDNVGTILDFVYLMPGQPPMQPELGYIVIILFFPRTSFLIELPAS